MWIVDAHTVLYILFRRSMDTDIFHMCTLIKKSDILLRKGLKHIHTVDETGSRLLFLQLARLLCVQSACSQILSGMWTSTDDFVWTLQMWVNDEIHISQTHVDPCGHNEAESMNWQLWCVVDLVGLVGRQGV